MEIKGNLEVTRSMSVASKLSVHESASVEGNLRVGGWLDAKNIKSPCKGLFADAQQLADKYPNPRPGWWALVGDSIPAEIYRSDGCQWVATGAMGGETVVDLNSYNDAIDEIREGLSEINDALSEIEHPVDVADTEQECDIDVADEAGNVILRIAQGHIRTKNFDSANIKAQQGSADVIVGNTTDDVDSDLDIADAAGHVLVRFAGGHVQTKCFDSANAANELVDRSTGYKYELCVDNGVLSCRRKPINILVLGNSFTRHAPNTSYGWNCTRGMASTVSANDYVSLLAEGTGGSVCIATIAGEAACVDFERNYSPSYNFNKIRFDRTLDYDLVIVELNENASYNSTMQASWEALYGFLRMALPSARILQLIGWNVDSKTAAITAACDNCGVTLLNNHSLTYTAILAEGQYVTGDDSTSAYPVTQAIVTHPSDVGMLLIANRILETVGFPTLDLLHDIVIEPSEGGRVKTFNNYPHGVARGLITLKVTPDSGRSLTSLTVRTTGDNARAIEVTKQASGIYTFFMPNEPVKVETQF